MQMLNVITQHADTYLLSAVAENGLVVLNSEVHPWLDSKKPDFAILPNPYWARRERTMTDDIYRDGKFGIVPHNSVYDTVRSLIDAKFYLAKGVTFDNKDRGQIKDYAVIMSQYVEGVDFHGKKYLALSDLVLRSFLSQFLCRSPDKPKNGF
jgi:hypothetical protein